MTKKPLEGDDAPVLRAWLDAARDDLGAREPPVWLEFQLRERLAERAALMAVRDSRETSANGGESADAPARAAALTGWRALGRLLPRSRPALAAVATGFLALGIGLAVVAPMLAPVAPRGVANGQVLADRSPFIALASLDAIAAEPGATVVPGRLPRMALVDFGLPVDPARADVPLNAEFLMSPRGVVLAVRFVE